MRATIDAKSLEKLPWGRHLLRTAREAGDWRRAVPGGLRRAVARTLAATGDARAALRWVGDLADDPAVERYREILNVVESGPAPLPACPRPGRPFSGRAGWLVHNRLPWDASGYAIRTQRLRSALEARGVHVDVWSRPGYPEGGGRARDDGRFGELLAAPDVPYRRGPDSAYADAYADLLVARARSRGLSLLHAAPGFVNGMAAARAARALGIPWIYELRGLWHDTRASADPSFAGSTGHRYEAAMERHVTASAARVIVLSRAMRRLVAEWGIPEERIAVVPNGVDDGAFATVEGEGAEVRRRWGLDGLVIGFAGSLTRYEGLDVLFDAVRRCSGRGPRIRVVVVGDGPEREGLERSGAALGAVFPGRVPPSEVPAWLAAFDVFVLPRRNTPVCRVVPSLKLPEALASGRCVIASDLAVVREATDDGRAALLVPPEDPPALAAAIAAVAEDPERRRRLGEAGRALAERTMRWRDVVRATLDVYESVCHEERR